MQKRSWMGIGYERIPCQILTVSIYVAISLPAVKARPAVRDKLYIYLSDIIDICIIFITSVCFSFGKIQKF